MFASLDIAGAILFFVVIPVIAIVVYKFIGRPIYLAIVETRELKYEQERRYQRFTYQHAR